MRNLKFILIQLFLFCISPIYGQMQYLIVVFFYFEQILKCIHLLNYSFEIAHNLLRSSF